MKKVLKFRQNNKLTEAAFLNINDAKLANRARDLARLAKKSREAAKKAEQQQKIDLMNKLNKQAEDIDEVIKGIYQDSIDKASGEQPSINNNSSEQAEDQKASQSETADQEQENSAEEETEQENSQEASKEKSKTDSSAENKNANPTESEKDEQQNSSKSSSSKEDSGEDSEGKSQGESDDEGDEGDDGNDGEDEGDEGSEGDSEEESGDEGDSEEEDGSDEGDGDSEDAEGSGDDQEEESEGSEGDEEDSEDNEQESEEDDSDDSDGSDESEEEQKKEKQSKGGGGSSGEESEEESEDESEEDSEGDDSDGSESEESEEDDSDGDSESEPVIDPFADEEDIPQFPQGGGGGEEPREADLDDIIKMLKGLKGRAKEGAISGVQNILDNKYGVTESLTEATKNIRKMDDDEFGDYVNELVDLIQQADDLEEVSDIEDRLNKIDKMKNNPATQRAIQADDTVALRKDYVAKKAREAENAKYQNYPTIKQFEIDFYETIKAQVDKVKQTIQSYDEINNEYESENIIMKADVDREIPEESKPIIDFYFDCSGSWTKHSDAVEIGKRAVATVQEFADRDEIKLNVYYFGRNDLSTNMNDVWGGGTKCWDAIIQNIKATKAKNVVLMTDCDMALQAKMYPACVVEGCVWFIWSLYDYTRGSRQIVKHLKGMEGQAQFAFGSGGVVDPADRGDND